MKKPLPSQARLRELLDYDPLTGGLVWKFGRGGEAAGSPACYRMAKYLGICVDYEKYVAHRVIWVWMTGEDPGDMEIDHIDRDPRNNRWDNLRLADVGQNRSNVAARNKTGLPKGVFPSSAKCESYFARIQRNGKKHYLGTFNTPEEAHEAYCQAAAHLHGEFAAA